MEPKYPKKSHKTVFVFSSKELRFVDSFFEMLQGAKVSNLTVLRSVTNFNGMTCEKISFIVCLLQFRTIGRDLDQESNPLYS